MALQGDGFDHNDYYRLTGKKPDEEGGGAEEKAPEGLLDDIGGNFRPEVGGTGVGSGINLGNDSSVTIGSGDAGNDGYGAGVDGGFNVGGDLIQTIGKQGDMTTSIGDGNTFSGGANIGNDYSETIGSTSAGNRFGKSLEALRQAQAQAGAFARSR